MHFWEDKRKEIVFQRVSRMLFNERHLQLIDFMELNKEKQFYRFEFPTESSAVKEK